MNLNEWSKGSVSQLAKVKFKLEFEIRMSTLDTITKLRAKSAKKFDVSLHKLQNFLISRISGPRENYRENVYLILRVRTAILRVQQPTFGFAKV
jgi:hypothetical protein